jgi:hypothetical protein
MNIKLSAILTLTCIFAVFPEISFGQEKQNIFAPDKNGNVIPDFSMAGYMGGGVKLLQVKPAITLSPRGGNNDRQRIQTALDRIAKMPIDQNGLRGALLLKKGTYRVNGSLYIAKSGVVLLGEGQNSKGTIIIATKIDKAPWNKKHALIYIGDQKNSHPQLGFLSKKGDKVAISNQYVPVGSKKINVQSSTSLKVGDNIIVELIPNAKWLQKIKLEKIWNTELAWHYIRYERKIIAINGNELTIDAPLVSVLNKKLLKSAYIWKYSDKVRISQCGVEKVRLISAFNAKNPDDEDHAVDGILINKARDCWVKNVTTLHFSRSAVEIAYGARNITVQDCTFLRPISRIFGSRRYAFMLNGSRCLVQRCYARQARHAFVSSSKVRGPNVFLDCLSEKDFAEIGPHHRWATGFLYDNITSPQGRMYVQNRGKMCKHGWTGVNQVFWNCKVPEIMCDEPPTGDRNWCIGCIGAKRSGWIKDSNKKFGTWISHGKHVKPRSLYLQQLEKRLGKKAVENITTKLQRDNNNGAITKYLKKRYAELNKREKLEDKNLFYNTNFSNSIKPNSSIPFSWRLECKNKKNKILKRLDNPVWGDKSALRIPANATFSTIIRFTPYGFATPRTFSLSFNYQLPLKGKPKIAICYFLIAKDNSWKAVKAFSGPVLKQTSKWQKYNYQFKISPIADGSTGMAYPGYLKIRLICDNAPLIIANPSLNILFGKQ